MYKSIRIIRIIVALSAMIAPTFALVAGWDSLFGRMQITMAILTGAAFWLLVWLVATLIYGRIYCSTVCPLGTLQDCIATLWRLTPPGRRDRRRGYRYHAPLEPLRVFVLVLVAACITAGWLLIPMLLDPYSTYARIVEQFVTAPLTGRGPAVPFAFATFAVAFSGLAINVAFSLRRGRLLCNTICPVGSLLGLLGNKAFFHADINTDKCIGCGRCEQACKAECINLKDHTVDVSRCVVCFKCMSVCPNDAITYRTGRHRLGMPLMQPTTSIRMDAPANFQPFNEIENETVSETPERHS
ncbi:MAG: 4Fe-4S binding protein [Muribaculaceae bacterium]|nr:4Fe-4S binding protein [Muribaculaceae bacterium]